MEASLKALQERVEEMHRIQLQEEGVTAGDMMLADYDSELKKVELEGVTKKVDGILEQECRDLFFVTATCVFSHILLHDPLSKFRKVMVPMLVESYGDLVPAMEVHVNTQLRMFCYGDGEEPAVESLLSGPEVDCRCLK
ncbi:hypothetical protein D1007_17097 [Hordeum vulgare]|nr:hypothetical protein D1007_17097 [Hordeum vulgare]